MTYRAFFLPLLGALLLAGCSPSNRLHEYDFDAATVAVVANFPPRPAVFTDAAFDARIHPDDPLGSVFRAGSALAKHAEARRAQARMDSALAYVDVAERTARRALGASAQALGYEPVEHPREADYLLDIRILHYGLVADSWEAAVFFEVEAEMRLLDRATRKTIWRRRVREAEAADAAALGLGTTFGNIYTARALSKLSVDEMIVALEDLADFTAGRLAGALRHDFYARR